MSSSPLCVVVGVGSGLGFSVAKRFGREGFRLALVARTEDTLEKHIDALKELSVEARAFAADAERAESLQDALRRIEEDMGPVEVLVYNAAAVNPAMPTGLGVEALMRDLRVNVGGALVAAQAVLPHMREKKAGTILFTGGGLALEPWPEMTSLAIGKAGIRSLAFSLSKEVGREGIHVATVTIAGIIKPGTSFDPDALADVYWALHTQPKDGWEVERVIR